MGCHLVNYISLGMLASDIKSINDPEHPNFSFCVYFGYQISGPFFLVANFCQLATKEKKEGCHLCVYKGNYLG
jgi:hypothetical protein